MRYMFNGPCYEAKKLEYSEGNIKKESAAQSVLVLVLLATTTSQPKGDKLERSSRASCVECSM